jgi:D-alanyl-D-alanine endopeptidase (penicillin-binding protein 7)
MKKILQICVVLGFVLGAQGAFADAESSLRNTVKPLPVKLSRNVPAPHIRSHYAMIFDERTQSPLYYKNADVVTPIASITKLMTAIVTLDAMLPMNEKVAVAADGLNMIKRAKSKLKVGMMLTREELLQLALMASANRAASALARSYPGGQVAFVKAMNDKALELGMLNTRFVDPVGLSSKNVSTARDLIKLVAKANGYTLIQKYTTSASHSVDDLGGREMHFRNTNPLVRSSSWNIRLSKTGFISEAGLCLVMEAKINNRPTIIVLLNSWGSRTRIGDANRIKRWVERAVTHGI